MIRRHLDPAPWIGGTRGDRLERMMAAAQRGGLIRKTKHRTPVGRSFLIGPTISFPLLLFPSQGLSLHSGPNAHPYSREAQASLQNTTKPGASSHSTAPMELGRDCSVAPGPKLEHVGWRSFEIRVCSHTRKKVFFDFLPTICSSQLAAPPPC